MSWIWVVKGSFQFLTLILIVWVKSNEANLASIACFNVFLLRELLLWTWFDIDASKKLFEVDWSVWDWIWKWISVRPSWTPLSKVTASWRLLSKVIVHFLLWASSSKILFYLAQNISPKINSTLLYTIFTTKGLIIFSNFEPGPKSLFGGPNNSN